MDILPKHTYIFPVAVDKKAGLHGVGNNVHIIALQRPSEAATALRMLEIFLGTETVLCSAHEVQPSVADNMLLNAAHTYAPLAPKDSVLPEEALTEIAALFVDPPFPDGGYQSVLDFPIAWDTKRKSKTHAVRELPALEQWMSNPALALLAEQAQNTSRNQPLRIDFRAKPWVLRAC